MSSPASIAVALLYESNSRTDHVRDTLTALGTPIVYESAARSLDRDALERSQASVVIVNLEDEDSPDLEAVYALLADDRYKVVFNDSGVTSGLSGWDHARWVRHLSAKVLDRGDLDPPRPANAEPVPVRAPVARPIVPEDTFGAALVEPDMAAERLPAQAPPASRPLEAQVPAEPAFDPTEILQLLEQREPEVADRAERTFDLEIAPDLDATPDAVASGDAYSIDGADDLLADFEMTPIEALEEPQFDEDFVVELPASTDEIPVAVGLPDALEIEPAPTAETSSELDFDFDFDLDDAPSATDAGSVAASAAVPASPVMTGSSALWSLEDFGDEEATPPVPTGPANFGIETMSAAEYLTPEGGDPSAQPEVPSMSELSFELIPLEEAVTPTPVERPDHENWLDPDLVKPKIQRVWVLGASVGGPESVREFLAEFPRDVPALFVLAQHLGDEFVDMMAKQLARATPLTVRTPSHGERVAHGDIVIVPNAHRIQIDPMGVVTLEKAAASSAYKPSIDRVIEDMADRYGEHAGAIVFSGMSDDAVSGCVHLVGKGGKVYAQSPESCVVSTMVEGVREAGIVSFVGTPKELAHKVLSGEA